VFQHQRMASLQHVAAGHDAPIRSIAIEDLSPLNNFLALRSCGAWLLGLAGVIALRPLRSSLASVLA
jgi:hypothetical protein